MLSILHAWPPRVRYCSSSPFYGPSRRLRKSSSRCSSSSQTAANWVWGLFLPPILTLHPSRLLQSLLLPSISLTSAPIRLLALRTLLPPHFARLLSVSIFVIAPHMSELTQSNNAVASFSILSRDAHVWILTPETATLCIWSMYLPLEVISFSMQNFHGSTSNVCSEILVSSTIDPGQAPKCNASLSKYSLFIGHN